MVLVILICLVQIILHFLVSFCLPEPFADEVSHVPQAMKYLEGKYKTWNPMITTPPGLYIASVALLYPLKRMGLYKSKRATIFFRIINPMMSILFLLLSDTDKLWKNTIILLIPILYPYTHLFYTDVASMLLVHISSQFYFSREYYKSALIILFGMFFRQTNILWSTFFAILRAFEFVGQPIWSFTGFCSLFKDEVGYIVNALLFVGFAIVNNGIVLGDRKNHAARFHIPQLFYCLTTIVLLALPILDPKGLISSLLDSLRHHYITWTLSFILHICCVRYLTFQHPYLQYDPEHLTTAIWRLCMGSHNMTKYLWIPLYMVSEYAVVKSLLVASGVRFIIAYLITTGLSIVPSPLIEPRYYVVPCAIFIKAIADHSDCQKLAAYYLVVDVILLLLLSGIFGQRQIW